MGLATEQEAKLVVEMVARYPEVKEELLMIEDAMEKFDRLNTQEVPTHLKSQIRSKIDVLGAQFSVPGAERSVSSSPAENTEREKVRSLNGSAKGEVKQNNFFKYAAAIAIILLLWTSYTGWTLTEMLTTMNEKLKNARDSAQSLRADLADQNEKLKAVEDEIALLKTPSMKSIELKGMEVAPDAKAMAYANTNTGEVYLEIMNLPAAPEGMQYQFWGIVDDKPVDAGMIPLEGDLSGIHPMTTVPNANAYAISLEPKGGSQQPTGKIYVMGTP